MSRSFLSIFFSLTLLAGASGLEAATTVLYDAALHTTPATQGWIYGFYPPLLLKASVSLDGQTGEAILDSLTREADMAGYFSSTPAYGTIPAMSNPNMPDVLDPDAGFRVILEVGVEAENHSDADRSGFSLIVTSADTSRALELAFWENEIWTQEGGDADLFTRAEGATVDTTGVRRYEVRFLGNAYHVSVDGVGLLSGSLRDYSGFVGTPPFNHPYITPNFIFFGDDTSSAAAKVRLRALSVTQPLGDVDGDGDADLADAMIALRVLAGHSPEGSWSPAADVDGDGVIGLAEASFCLRRSAMIP